MQLLLPVLPIRTQSIQNRKASPLFSKKSIMSNRLPEFPLVDEAYRAEEFQRQGQAWTAVIHQHLQAAMLGKTKALNWTDPQQALQLAESSLQESSSDEALSDRFQALVKTMLDHGQNLHHPGYVGHQVAASIPVAGLFDAVGSVTNQAMAIYEMGPWATVVEHALLRKLAALVGWDPDTSSGLLTHGGSLANLTALLTARNIAFPNCWEDGCPSNAVIVSHAESHYCVSRSAGILGMGTKQIRSVTLDDERRMDPVVLQRVLEKCHAANEKVVAVVAVACATATGAFDRLNAIADICERFGVWLHVDAAHGGGVLMSSKHRHLAAGIERADSVVWDAHKMLFVPALCAAVLYRKAEHQLAAFQQNAPYLFQSDDRKTAVYDSGIRTLECTKRACGFGLWGAWSLFGREVFEQIVDKVFALAKIAAEELDAADDFERPFCQDANIIVYRHLPEQIRAADIETQNQFQFQLREQLVHSGDFYIVQTVIDKIAYLRMVTMNPMTTVADLERLFHALREDGKNLLQSDKL